MVVAPSTRRTTRREIDIKPSGRGTRAPLSLTDPLCYLVGRLSDVPVSHVLWFDIADMPAVLSGRRLIPGTARAALGRPRAGLLRTFSPRHAARTGST